jgi:hypothetical protein
MRYAAGRRSYTVPTTPTKTMHARTLRPLAVLALLAASATPQGTPAELKRALPTAPAPQRTQERFVRLRYPRDREYVVASVDGAPITLEDLCRHIDERHRPGFRRELAGPPDHASPEGSPDGARILESDLIAPWVRQYAHIKALQAVAKERGVDVAPAEQSISAALKAGFQAYLDRYVAGLQAQHLPTELSQRRVNSLLNEYQFAQGLACELQGWIDFLAPERQWTEQQVHDYFQANVRCFGSGVTIDHILVQHRDAGTGILLDDEGRRRALARIAEIRGRLAKDGSNFEEIARLYSEDSKTTAEGGRIEGVERFDQRLPAAICRAAWFMKDGEISDLIETQYGFHIVRRIELVQKKYILYTPGAMPAVRLLMKKSEQENLLFDALKKHPVDLRL